MDLRQCAPEHLSEHPFRPRSPATGAGPLVWCDAQGNPAVLLRTWWVRNPETLFAETAECVGSDLIVRADVFDRLTHLYSVPLRELRAVWRRPMAEDDETPAVRQRP